MKIVNLDSLKLHIDIVEIISHFLVLRRQGRNYVATCPFHNEKTASFVVNQAKNMYYCFGCNAGGDAIKFVQDYCKVEFQDAIFQIANILNLHVETQNNGVAGNFKDVTKEYYECNQVFLDYVLSNSNVIESYVLSRGITTEVFKEFKLGFAGESFEILKALDKNIPTNTTQNTQTHKITNSIINKTACKLGLITDTHNGYMSYFYRRLIIPIFDTLGRVVGFSGRLLKDSQNANTPKYINSKESPIYKKKHILYGFHIAKHALTQQKTNKEIYIVEGYFDVLALHSVGIKHAVGICGTALTKEHIALLQKYECDICLSLDSDSAGKMALKRSIELLLSFEIYNAYVLDFNSKYKDCNDILLHEKEKLLNPKKIPIIEYYIKAFIYEKFIGIENLQQTQNLSIEKKNNILKECVAFLDNIKSEFIRNEYFLFANKLFGFNLRENTNTTQIQHSQIQQQYKSQQKQYYKNTYSQQQYNTQYKSQQYNYKQQKYSQYKTQQYKSQNNITKNHISQNTFFSTNDVLELQLLKSAFRNKDKIELLRYYADEKNFFNKDAYNAIIKNEFTQQVANIIMNDSILEYENIESFSKDLSIFLKSKAKVSIKSLKNAMKKTHNEIKENNDIEWLYMKEVRARLFM